MLYYIGNLYYYGPVAYDIVIFV